MVVLKCSTPDKLLLTQLQPFQGQLKKRSKSDVDLLKESIKTDGLLMPFAVWQNEDKNYLLDGHGRYQALVSIALEEQPDILQQEFPAVFIKAETELEARKALLQITSMYGSYNKSAAIDFAKDLAGYVAPVLNLRVKPVAIYNVKRAKNSGKRLIRLLVSEDKADALRKMLEEVDGIELL